jgi:regulator of sigma E protease
LENLIYVSTIVWNILKAALGVGFVIFIHELGHFALAKWNGVKVLRFSIGFGPPIISYRKGVGLRAGTGSRPPGPNDPPGWGETEYWLAYIPLGGYVMMFGENAEESTAEGDVSADPRAYKNKSVWGRMQIITAGVIMNVILGFVCFTYVYTQGMLELAGRIGAVFPGSPSYKAGLLAGDEVVAIDGQRDVAFRDLMSRVRMSGSGQKIKFTIRRAGLKDEKVIEIEPVREASSPHPTIGVLPDMGLDLLKTPFRALPGQLIDKAKPNPGFDAQDKVLAVGPEGGPLEPVQDQVEFVRLADKFRDRPLVVEVERKKAEPGDSAILAKVVVPPHRFLDFGLRLTAGPIAGIRADSPASKAGLREGDRIEKVDGDPDFDPMRLPDYARDHEGKPITLAIVRSVDGKETRLDVTLTPDSSTPWSQSFGSHLLPLDISGFGMALAVEPKIKAVAEGSPAARAGLKVGETLRSMILTPAKEDDEKAKPKPTTIQLDDKVVGGWPAAFVAVQEMMFDSIELTTDKSDKPIKIMPELDPSRYYPDRGLRFQNLVRKMPPLGLVDAMSRGAEETVDNIKNTVLMFRGMFQRRIGADAVGGVIPIAQVAYDAASDGWTSLLHLLGALSVGLAVLNFLPIPPLDGGQFTLLVMEKVRGKPLPEWMVNAVTIAGLVFVLCLILLVNGRDVLKLVQSFL